MSGSRASVPHVPPTPLHILLPHAFRPTPSPPSLFLSPSPSPLPLSLSPLLSPSLLLSLFPPSLPQLTLFSLPLTSHLPFSPSPPRPHGRKDRHRKTIASSVCGEKTLHGEPPLEGREDQGPMRLNLGRGGEERGRPRGSVAEDKRCRGGEGTRAGGPGGGSSDGSSWHLEERRWVGKQGASNLGVDWRRAR